MLNQQQLNRMQAVATLLASPPTCAQAAESAGGLVNIRPEGEASEVEVLAMMTTEERQCVQNMMNNPNIYTDVSRSLAPGVFGAEDIKKAVLLMLLGGVHKQTPEVRAHRVPIATPDTMQLECATGTYLPAPFQFLSRWWQCMRSAGAIF